MQAAKKRTERWQLGDSGWEVEWCVEQWVDPENPGYGDPDMDKYAERCFRAEASARAFVKKIRPTAACGWVRLTPFTLEPLSDTWPYGCHRVYTADSEFFDDLTD